MVRGPLFAQPPAVTLRRRALEVVGLAMGALLACVAWRGATDPDAARRAGEEQGFRIGVALALMWVCYWPLWARLRDARLWRASASLLARCPGCGAPGDGSAGCARCGFPARDNVGWTLESIDPYGGLLFASFAGSLFSLAWRCVVALVASPSRVPSVALAAGAAVFGAGGFVLAVLGIDLVRSALQTPPRFTWRRSWRIDDEGAYTEAEVVASPGAPSAHGTTRLMRYAATALQERAIPLGS